MTEKQTLLGARLAEKWITARRVQLEMALAQFRNNGGQVEELFESACRAYADQPTRIVAVAARILNERGMDIRAEKGSAGLHTNADEAGMRLPGASRSIAAEGRAHNADEANALMPDAATTRDGAGHSRIAEKASEDVPAPVSPRKSRAQRLAEGVSVEAAYRSAFDRIILPDGRRLGQVHWSECPSLALRYRKLSRILMAIHNHGTPPDPNTTLDNVVSEGKLQEIVAAVELVNDLH